jgi:hypothetical protein
VAREAKVAGLVRLGPDPADPAQWVAATGGRVSIGAFDDLAALRKRFRRRGADPARIVAVVPPSATGPRVMRDPGEVLDALGPGPGPVVAWLPADAQRAFDAGADVAVFAPQDAVPADQPLATQAAIVDPSRPSAPVHQSAPRSARELLADRLARALTLLRTPAVA